MCTCAAFTLHNHYRNTREAILKVVHSQICDVAMLLFLYISFTRKKTSSSRTTRHHTTPYHTTTQQHTVLVLYNVPCGIRTPRPYPVLFPHTYGHFPSSIPSKISFYLPVTTKGTRLRFNFMHIFTA